MELRDYLRVARRRWRLIVTSLLVVVALAAFVTYQTTPQYESRSRLFVSTSDQTTSEAFQGGNFAIQRVTSYADLVNGQELSSRVVKKLGLHMTAAHLSAKISASVVPDTVILEITATDPDPRTAQKISQTTATELSSFVQQLETPSGFTLMGADTPAGMDHDSGTGITVCLSGTDVDDLRGYFDKLSEGAAVSMPLEKQMWGDEFGMCTDQFGVDWMVNIVQESQA